MVGLVSPQSIVCTSRKLMFKVFSYFSQFPYKFPSQGKHLLLKSAWGKWKRRIWKTFPIFLRKDYWKKVISALLISCDSPWSENPANFRDQISNAENSMIYLQFITVNGASCNFLNNYMNSVYTYSFPCFVIQGACDVNGTRHVLYSESTTYVTACNLVSNTRG